jgi:hypothetical protein
MQLIIKEDETYTVVLKTYWIRLIQRHWKKFFKEKQRVIINRCTLKSLKYFELHGKYLPECKIYYSLQGMMNMYK